MPVELRVPSVGESITEVQIGEWLKSPGAEAARDESLVVIETDKVTVELPAPVDGKLTEVLIASGQTANVGDLIGYMEEGPVSAPVAAATSADAGAASDTAPAAPLPRAGDGSPSPASTVMPAARAELARRGLDAEEVTPTGPGGRLLKEDVLRHEPSAGAPPRSSARPEELVPLSPLRKRIAERLVQAQQQAAILTTFNEIDMSAVKALRKQNQDRFVERHGVKVGFMSFFVKATVEALKRVPQVNAEFRGDGVLYRNYFDIGIAVGGGKGLVVPILRNAEGMSFAEIEKKIAELAGRARDNKLTLEELTGGTFTISNGGIYGSLLSTPIINPPQSGILGLHAIQDRPVAVNGEIQIRPMMYVALSYDHRLIDGREAVTFLKTIKESVEDPARMLLEI